MPAGQAFKEFQQADPLGADAAIRAAKRYLWRPIYPAQAEIVNSRARFRVVDAGRRAGKSEIGAHEILKAAREPDQTLWWVANTFKNVRRGYRKVLRYLPPQLLAKPAPPPTANDIILQFKNGTTIEFLTAGTPDALASEGVDFVVVDEAALIPDYIWYQLIRPTLADKMGRALLISTPRATNYFKKLVLRGEDPAVMDTESWRLPTSVNPIISPEEIETARQELPRLLFEQEFLAEFVSGASAIFNIPAEMVIQELRDPRPGEHVVVGVDLAKRHDFTVISASGEDRLPVWFDRFNSIRWPEQRERIKDAVADIQGFGAYTTVLVDATGIGDVIVDDLEDEGMDVIPVDFRKNNFKQQAVKRLAKDFEDKMAYVYAPTLQEFEQFEFEISPAGNFKYHAPDGGYDDMVSAKLLEHWGQEYGAPPDMSVISSRDEESDDEFEEEEETVEEETFADLLWSDRPGLWHR